MAVNKPIREIGMIIGKKISEAREAGESFDGSRKWEAKEEEYILDVVSCDEEDFDKNKGFLNGTRLDYKVDKETYEKARFGGWAKVKYFMVQFADKPMQPKADSLILIEKN